MTDKWTMYDTIMRKAERDGEPNTARWARTMRDRQARPPGKILNDLLGEDIFTDESEK